MSLFKVNKVGSFYCILKCYITFIDGKKHKQIFLIPTTLHFALTEQNTYQARRKQRCLHSIRNGYTSIFRTRLHGNRTVMYRIFSNRSAGCRKCILWRKSQQSFWPDISVVSRIRNSRQRILLCVQQQLNHNELKSKPWLWIKFMPVSNPDDESRQDIE